MIVLKRLFFGVVVAITAMEFTLSNLYRMPAYWYLIAITLGILVSLHHFTTRHHQTEHAFYESSKDRLLTSSLLTFMYSGVSFAAAQFIVSEDFHPKARTIYYGILLLFSFSLFIQYLRLKDAYEENEEE